MKTYLYYVLYEILLWHVERHPAVRLQWWYPLVLKELAPDWITVKTKMTLADVDRQLKSIDVGESGVPDPVYEQKASEVEGLSDISLSAPWRRD